MSDGDEARKYVSSKVKGEQWVERALPVVVKLAMDIKKLKKDKAEDEEFAKALLKDVSDKYNPQIKALTEVDVMLRERILKEHDGSSTVAVAGVGELVFPQVWDFEVVDMGKVDRKYLIVDSTAVRNDIRKGIRNIKGIKIDQKRTLQVRPHTDKGNGEE